MGVGHLNEEESKTMANRGAGESANRGVKKKERD
jgi:hypothetical protein